MNDVQFETPENVLVTYRLAGFGSRFIAYLIDQLVLLGALLAAGVVAMVLSYGSDEDLSQATERVVYMGASYALMLLLVAVVGIVLVNAFAYGLMELCLRGRTVGKKVMGLRVVKANGFNLDATAVLLRNVARILDLGLLLPPVILPTLFVAFVTEKRQRLGDLLAGTLVVHDGLSVPQAVLDLRARLENRRAEDVRFALDPSAVARVPEAWVEAAEKTLARFRDLPDRDRARLRQEFIAPLAAALHVEPPSPADESRFLADFLATFYRGEYRKLG